MGPKSTRWNVKEQVQQETTIVQPDKKHRPALNKLADEYTRTVLNG
jgi:hypothetical protein